MSSIDRAAPTPRLEAMAADPADGPSAASRHFADRLPELQFANVTCSTTVRGSLVLGRTDEFGIPDESYRY